MPYSKKIWTPDDPITDVALNNIENGVANAHTILDATGTPLSLSGSTGNLVGTAIAKAKADHTHALLANGTPSTQAIGDAATVGSSAHLARADHKHGMPSFGSGANNLIRGNLIRGGHVYISSHQMNTIFTVSFGFTFPSIPIVILTPTTPPSYATQLYVVSTTTTSVDIRSYDRDFPDAIMALAFNWIAVVNP